MKHRFNNQNQQRKEFHNTFFDLYMIIFSLMLILPIISVSLSHLTFIINHIINSIFWPFETPDFACIDCNRMRGHHHLHQVFDIFGLVKNLSFCLSFTIHLSRYLIFYFHFYFPCLRIKILISACFFSIFLVSL